jgi:tellurite resistance protein
MSTAPSASLSATTATAAAVRVPASLFSTAAGLGALSAAWRGAARAYAVSPWLADALLAVAVALWVALFAAQVVKAFGAAGKLRAELEHPVEGSLAALAPIALLVLAAGISIHYRELATVLFWIGAAWQLVHGVWIAGRWLGGSVEPKLVTPAMYLPTSVGNLAAAIAAGTVGRTDVGWLFFGAGVATWVVLAAVLLVRHLSEGELTPALRPLLGIELAPPALALAAWQALEGNGGETTSRALLGIALFVALVLVRLVGRFRDVPFTPAYWAFAFPVATLSAATLRAPPGSVAGDLALPIFVVANALVAAVAYKTIAAASRGRLAPPG